MDNRENNDGKDYEMFVAILQQMLLCSDEYINQNNIKVEVNKIITDNSGIDRQFDIYWEYEFGGIIYRTVIECKDYASPISIDKIDALLGKLNDIPDIDKAIFATKTGYQKGAKTKAKRNNIELLVVREQNESDWIDENGKPLIKIINIQMLLESPANLITIVPVFDKAWLEQHSEFDVSQGIRITGNNMNIFINDVEAGERYNLKDLVNKLADKYYPEEVGEICNIEINKKLLFNNAYIENDKLSIKIKNLNIKFSLPRIIERNVEIDVSAELLGVIEYLQRQTKKIIFRNGAIKHNA